jgi:thiosulfate dehydrogenase (quinone) large subunit
MRLPGEILQGILARAALVLLRLYVGLVFLVKSLKEMRGNTPEHWPVTEGTRLGQAPAFARQVIQDLVLPNAEHFRSLIVWGQLSIGLFLILGLMTRLWAAAAIVLCVGYTLGEQAGPWTPGNATALLGAMSLAILLGAGGRTLGFDSTLARRWPRSPFW